MCKKAPDLTISILKEQLNIIRRLKKQGTKIAYPRPVKSIKYEVNMLAFTDASTIEYNSHLGIVTILLNGKMRKDSVNHVISWI